MEEKSSISMLTRVVKYVPLLLVLFGSGVQVKAWDVLGVDYSGSVLTGNRIWGIDLDADTKTLLTTKVFDDNSWSSSGSYVNSNSGELVIRSGAGTHHAYNWKTDVWRDIGASSIGTGMTTFMKPAASGGNANDAISISNEVVDMLVTSSGLTKNESGTTTNIISESSGTVEVGGSSATLEVGTGDNPTTINSEGVSVGGSNLIKETSGTVEIGGASAVVEIGTGDNPTTISSEGVSVGGSNLIKRSGGTVSIGENSLKLREQGGRQQMWATDANGDAIDIDVTNGSRLLINGRDVEKSIDNVGALSAALGSVPAISADSQFTCGLGGGAHSSAYALSAGCASRVSDRVSVNAALATVINNHTGDTDDNLSARAGFTFRLGKIDDSPKVAARKAAELYDKVAKLEQRNESLIALLQAQASRLERLEQLASGQLSLMGDRASSD